MSLEVTGTQQLRMKLDALTHVSKDEIEKALTEAAEPVRKSASEKAPRSDEPGSEGHMADNIIVHTRKRAGKEIEVGVGPSKNHWYGIFTEVGTKFAAAQPWLRPAFDENKENVKRILVHRLKSSWLADTIRRHDK